MTAPPDEAAASKHGWPSVPAGTFLLSVGLIWAFELGLSVVLAGVLMLASEAGPRGVAGGDHLSPRFVAAALVTTFLSALFTLAVTWYAMCRRARRAFFQGFLFGRFDRAAVFSVLVGAGLVVAALWLRTTWLPKESFMSKLARSPVGLLAVMLLGLMLPFVEEIYYRGFIFTFLEKRMRVVAAVALTSLWFAVAHAAQLWGDWSGLAVILVAGVVWTIQRSYYKQLLPPLLCHLTYNSLQLALAIGLGISEM